MALDQPPRSRARWLIPLALLAIVFAFCGGLALLMLGAVATAQKTPKGTILELKLSGEMNEQPSSVSALFPGLAGPPSIFEIRSAVLAAANDDDIAGLRVDIENAQVGWGAADELQAVLATFRKAKKPVHAYLRADFVNDIDYALALGADKVWMAPSAALAVNGFQAEVTFWRGTLDKLHIDPQYFMMKEYKSAGEPMTRREMSEYFRESTQALLSDIWEDLLGRIAERRKLDIASVRATASLGLVGASEAQAAKWVDELGYEDQLRSALTNAVSEDRYHSLTLRKYYDSHLAHKGVPTGDRIAVVFGSGIILTASDQGPFDDDVFSGPKVARAIREAADDDLVKGILLRVDSPGGTVVGSDHVWRAVEYARTIKRKSVVVSMASLAASGGYYVSAGADAIVAEPSTITGSIGVVFGKVNIAGLYELIGAHVDTVKVGDNADILSLVKSLDAEQSKRVLAWMEGTYEEFKRKVAQGRSLDPAKVEEVARGRVWSGLDAKDLGLVDRLGGYDEALEILREKAGIAADARLDLVVYPAPKSFLDLLFSEEAAADVRSVRALAHPEAALARALGEVAQPGVWVMMPEMRLR